MGQLRIALGDLTHTTISLSTDTIPLNIGFLAAYATKTFTNGVELRLYKYPEELMDALPEFRPHILALSNYPWNSALSQTVFAYYNSLHKGHITVMGGPNFPNDPEGQKAFLKKSPLVDFYIHLEGEKGFANLIGRYLSKGGDIKALKADPIEGCLFLDPESGSLVAGPLPQRFKDLDQIPSPYLEGYLDKFFDGKLSPFIEATRGCPFSCTFCHTGNKYFNSPATFSLERIRSELEYIVARAGICRNLVIADSNFGMYPRDLEVAHLLHDLQQRYNFPEFITATTGKNKPERILAVFELIDGLNLTASVQSMDETVLRNIKRKNISISSYMEIQREIHKRGKASLAEIITALPGETKESHLNTLKTLLDSEVDIIIPYTCMLLEGTELKAPQTREKYGIKTRFRIVPRDFGEYKGRKCFEVEEVVIATNTLSFEDYLSLRGAHNILNVFFYRDVFKEMLRYLKDKGVTRYEIFLSLYENLPHSPPAVKEYTRRFLEETKGELWASEQETIDFYSQSDNFSRLVSGELGGNLMQKYRALAITRYFEPLCQYLFQRGLSLLCTGGTEKSIEKELSELKLYTIAKVSGIFSLKEEDRRAFTLSFSHDIKGWIEEGLEAPLSRYLLPQGIDYRFSFSQQQTERLQEELSRFGASPQGIGKLMTRMDITNAFRQVAVVG